jgi:diguanylate cyclase (GGDEF)-like protein
MVSILTHPALVSGEPLVSAAQENADLLARCLRAMDLVDAVCKQRNVLEEELHALMHTITAMTIKLAATTADVSCARYQSFHDGLTSLPNRQLLLSTLVGLLSDRRREHDRLAVMYLDLDGFKSVNDLHGHQFGDQVLNMVGARLLRSLRAQDMVCRMGGDEFACLLSDAPNSKQLCAIASKLHAIISASALIGEREIKISPSIGIAVYPDDGTTAHDLLKSADVAMYAAKAQRSGYALAQNRQSSIA